MPALPDWAENYFANQRKYWTALREGGALTPEAEREVFMREVRGLAVGKPVATSTGECVPDGDTSSGEKR